TTAVEALRLGHNCICIDINPLTEFITRVKTQKINYTINQLKERKLTQFTDNESSKENDTSLKPIYLDKLLKKMENYSGERFYPHWGNIDHWYPPEFKEFLAKLWGFIYSLKENYSTDFIDLIKLTGLYMARYLSYGARDVPKLFRSKSRIKQVEELRKTVKDRPSLPIEVFKRKLIDNFKQILEYQKELQKKNIIPCYERNLTEEALMVDNVNSRKIICLSGTDMVSYNFIIKEEFIDLIVTSPPYIYAQEYMRSTKLDMYWLNLVDDSQVRQFTKKELGYKKISPKKQVKEELYKLPTFDEIFDLLIKEEKRRYGKNGKYTPQVINFFSDMFKIFEKLSKKLKKSGIFAFFVGNPTVMGHQVLCSEIFYEMFELLGYNILEYGYDEIMSRQLLRKRQNDSPEGMGCEWLIIAQKQ
ncbi:MAG: hypothetical protein ACFFDT_28645, partial [Candidatus Hodarchaeota archaeon]